MQVPMPNTSFGPAADHEEAILSQMHCTESNSFSIPEPDDTVIWGGDDDPYSWKAPGFTLTTYKIQRAQMIDEWGVAWEFKVAVGPGGTYVAGPAKRRD